MILIWIRTERTNGELSMKRFFRIFITFLDLIEKRTVNQIKVSQIVNSAAMFGMLSLPE